MTGTNEEARVFKHYLNTLEQKVFEEHRLMLDAKVQVTAENLRGRLYLQTSEPHNQRDKYSVRETIHSFWNSK